MQNAPTASSGRLRLRYSAAELPKKGDTPGPQSKTGRPKRVQSLSSAGSRASGIGFAEPAPSQSLPFFPRRPFNSSLSLSLPLLPPRLSHGAAMSPMQNRAPHPTDGVARLSELSGGGAPSPNTPVGAHVVPSPGPLRPSTFLSGHCGRCSFFPRGIAAKISISPRLRRRPQGLR